MAEQLTSLRKNGESITETVLWTNATPTVTFPSTTVTLSDDINNYKFIKIVCRASVNVATESSVIYSVEDYKNMIGGVSVYYGTITFFDGTSHFNSRTIRYSSSTAILLGNCYQYTNGGTAVNTMVVPVKVIGLK